MSKNKTTSAGDNTGQQTHGEAAEANANAAGAGDGAPANDTTTSQATPPDPETTKPSLPVGARIAGGPELKVEDVDGERVKMELPKQVKLLTDDHRLISFPAGVQDVPLKYADHWYLKAHGAKRV